VGLLIRYHAQRWLREPHEVGLHLTGGFLRIATWWIYTLGLVYTLLNIKVPYLPTPKEGNRKNEWLLSTPNLVLAIISIVVAGLSLTVQGLRGPYTKLMATLALINAAILLASVLMAQHALLDQLRDIMWTVRPLRALRIGVEKAWNIFTRIIAKSLRAGSVTFAVVLAVLHVLVSAGLVLLQWREQVSISADYIWAHTGFGTLHVGHPLGAKPVVVPATAAAPGLPVASFLWTKSPAALSQVVSIALPAGTTQLPTAQIERINQQHGIPLLTWQVEENDQVNKRFQEQILQLTKHKNHLLLQPIVPAKTPKGYRQAWQKLVTSYRATGDTTTVWVWTPPRPDSLVAYFPGSAYFTWMIYDGRRAPAASSAWAESYRAFRQQVAVQIAMQSKPIMVLVAPAGLADPYNWAQQTADQYSEIKAVVFGDSVGAAKP